MPKVRTYADRREYLIMAVARRRKRLREQAVEYKGGKCIFCGYNRCQAALDFHHLDAKEKEFGISRDGITRSWAKTVKELDKCVLVCSNCHREIHAGILQPSEVIQNGNNGVNSGKPKNGNPEPSLTNDVKVVRKVQRLRVRNQTNKLYKRPTSLV
jgi:hypothetical protein